ncbi:DUF1572 family protein [Desertivirga brevis]|uniref:DUF1572 family protein n=1 Tax=Desertivirga brevis TaxID=2810310 RepID=UPI001A9650FA|nr:DUF1572 family protein [Pedobacter sp. SYSU D00873]
MLIEVLKSLFNRDLNRLRTEISSYKNEENLWRVEESITNSAGNLCLHLIGNLNTYIGKEIGNTGYVRNRELEFSLKNVDREELLQSIDNTIKVVETSLDKLDERALAAEYPILVFDQKTSTEFLLVHLTTHLTYHLGQINYHRRMVDRVA